MTEFIDIKLPAHGWHINASHIISVEWSLIKTGEYQGRYKLELALSNGRKKTIIYKSKDKMLESYHEIIQKIKKAETKLS
jgi:hypothetical protein